MYKMKYGFKRSKDGYGHDSWDMMGFLIINRMFIMLRKKSEVIWFGITVTAVFGMHLIVVELLNAVVVDVNSNKVKKKLLVCPHSTNPIFEN